MRGEDSHGILTAIVNNGYLNTKEVYDAAGEKLTKIIGVFMAFCLCLATVDMLVCRLRRLLPLPPCRMAFIISKSRG